eukprot:2709618-Prymnesium_polylepis.1
MQAPASPPLSPRITPAPFATHDETRHRQQTLDCTRRTPARCCHAAHARPREPRTRCTWATRHWKGAPKCVERGRTSGANHCAADEPSHVPPRSETRGAASAAGLMKRMNGAGRRRAMAGGRRAGAPENSPWSARCAHRVTGGGAWRRGRGCGGPRRRGGRSTCSEGCPSARAPGRRRAASRSSWCRRRP